MCQTLTSIDGLVHGYHWISSLTDHPHWDVREPPTKSEVENATAIVRARVVVDSRVIVIEFSPAHGTVLTAALYQLDDTEPMEAMSTWQLSTLSHVLFAYSTFIFSTSLKVHDRVIMVQISEETSELAELIDLS
jgi:hypothetical protein